MKVTNRGNDEDSSNCQDYSIDWLTWDRKISQMRTNMDMLDKVDMLGKVGRVDSQVKEDMEQGIVIP